MTTVPSAGVIGVRIDYPTFAGSVDWVLSRTAEREGGYICHVNTHSVVEAHENPAVAAALRGAALALPDGMPLVWSGRWRGLMAERVYGPDLMRAVLAATRDGSRRHFLFGSTPQVLVDLTREICRTYPGVVICGTLSPPFGAISPQQQQDHLRVIRESGADCVWIGLGAPRQELWMADVHAALPGQVLFGVGAAFDFLAGTKPQAPAWMQRSGLEWAFRWATEPRRLTARYGRVLPLYLWLTLRDVWRSIGKKRAV